MNSVNYLKQLSDFERILKDYYPSKSCIEVFRSVPQVILVGPTAAGRNTMINLLVQTGKYRMIVSDTTRNKRVNNGILEENGKEYWFKSEDEFLAGVEKGEYIEAAIIHQQQVSGAHINEYKKAHKSGLIAVKEIEPNGAELYYELNSGLLAIFLLPPNFDVWMRRLRGRGHIEELEVIRRLQSAQEEISGALKKDYFQFVINNEIHEAAHAVDELAHGRKPDPAKQEHGRDHAKLLMQEVIDYLDKAT